MLPSLRGARAMPLLEGTDLAPVELLDAEDENKKRISVPNPAYDAWVAKDQQVVSFFGKFSLRGQTHSNLHH